MFPMRDRSRVMGVDGGNEVVALLFGAFGLFLAACLYSYNPTDSSWFCSALASHAVTKNWCGPVGAYLSSFLIYFLGDASTMLVPFSLVVSYVVHRDGWGWQQEWARLGAFFLFLVSLDAVLAFHGFSQLLGLVSGGYCARIMVDFFAIPFDRIGSGFAIYTVCMATFVLTTRLSFIGLIITGWQEMYQGVISTVAWNPLNKVRLWTQMLIRRVFRPFSGVRTTYDAMMTRAKEATEEMEKQKAIQDISVSQGLPERKLESEIPSTISTPQPVSSYEDEAQQDNENEQVGFESQETEGVSTQNSIPEWVKSLPRNDTDQEGEDEHVLETSSLDAQEPAAAFDTASHDDVSEEVLADSETTVEPKEADEDNDELAERFALDESSFEEDEDEDEREPLSFTEEDEDSKDDAYAVTSPKDELPLYELSIDTIFDAPEEDERDYDVERELEGRARALEQKLDRFGIAGRVVSIKSGPVVTLFEYEPNADIKISKILVLEDDLALALRATGIRIIAPIPGRSVVGFEVANETRSDVLFAKVVHSDIFQNFSGSLPLVIGEDTTGKTFIVDLASMPHLLIAGSTGSGKSVALNAMLVGLLCQRSPEELRLLLIDPKRLEFSAYADVPHLLFPIVTDVRKVPVALRWVLKQMEERYELMADVGVRSFSDYNDMADETLEFEPFPRIVMVVDELADLMMTAGREVEESIARIAQMARAAGIHMIVATQRPSVDVITGLIKVNFPSRLSLRVTSKVDSRTILDCVGADKLLGRGDMLFFDSGSARLVRVHGAYISSEQIKTVADAIRAMRPSAYIGTLDEPDRSDADINEEDVELYGEVESYVKAIEEISISMLQRKFSIGYNRSARIVSVLEARGVVASSDGGKMRKVIR